MSTQCDPRLLRSTEIPKLDSVLSRRTRQDVRRSRVPRDLSDLTGAGVDLRNGLKVLRDPALGIPVVEPARLDLPDRDRTVLATRCNEVVVMRAPVCVEHGSGVGTGKGYDVRELVWYLAVSDEWGGEREDAECTTTRGIPVDTDVFLWNPGQPAVWNGQQRRSDREYRRTPDALITFVSQAEFVTFTFSIPNSFFPVWPKTWLRVEDQCTFNDKVIYKGEPTDISRGEQSETWSVDLEELKYSESGCGEAWMAVGRGNGGRQTTDARECHRPTVASQSCRT
jgi:hypothetical protein